jgi:hypothetical protein
MNMAIRFMNWPTTGISSWARGSKVDEAPKPICREKNCPAVVKAANTVDRKNPMIIPIRASPTMAPK